jgi:hypothetical protein
MQGNCTLQLLQPAFQSCLNRWMMRSVVAAAAALHTARLALFKLSPMCCRDAAVNNGHPYIEGSAMHRLNIYRCVFLSLLEALASFLLCLDPQPRARACVHGAVVRRDERELHLRELVFGSASGLRLQR